MKGEKKIPNVVWGFYSTHKHALCICDEQLPDDFKAIPFISLDAAVREIEAMPSMEFTAKDDMAPFANQIIAIGYENAKKKFLARLREMAGKE